MFSLPLFSSLDKRLKDYIIPNLILPTTCVSTYPLYWSSQEHGHLFQPHQYNAELSWFGFELSSASQISFPRTWNRWALAPSHSIGFFLSSVFLEILCSLEESAHGSQPREGYLSRLSVSIQSSDLIDTESQSEGQHDNIKPNLIQENGTSR